MYQQHQYQQYHQPNPMAIESPNMMPQQNRGGAQTQPPIAFYFYYKTQCGPSARVMHELRQFGEIIQAINFISLDNYYRNQQGQGCVQLQNGAVIPIPPQVDRTPTLLAVKTSTNEIQRITGDEIKAYFAQYIQFLKKQATQGNDNVYEFTGFKGSSNVISDQYATLSELETAVDFDNPDHAGNGMGGVNLAARDGRGLLDQTLTNLKDNPDPTKFGGKIKDRDHMNTSTYNKNQFMIQPEYQTPDQFPREMFLEGQIQMPVSRGSQGLSYNPNEMAPPPPTAIPRQLAPMQTSSKRENYEGLETESEAMLRKIEAERNAMFQMGGRGGGRGGHGQGYAHGGRGQGQGQVRYF